MYLKKVIMKTRPVLTVFLLLLSPVFAQMNPVYKYSVNLTDIKKDRIEVTLECPDFAGEQLTYNFPKIVPGTYKVLDFGRFIHNFRAYDKNGKQLRCRKKGKNSFVISDAAQIHSIKYSVSDTWDMYMGLLRVFPMAGTNFDQGNNFVINPFAVFGYFEDSVLNPVDISFTKPAGLYGISALPQTVINSERVRFHADNYHHLADCPIMFAPPDTLRFNVHNTEILIGTYHETKSVSYAAKVHDSIYSPMMAISALLDSLPADNYAFIYYFSDAEKLGAILQNPRCRTLRIIGYLSKNGIPVGGALEHNNSTFGYSIDLGEPYTDRIMKMIAEMSVHEFFHIITPLNLHSQYIADFNYTDPVMSKHLWLYEGVTEYFSKLVLVRDNLKTPREFILKTMRNKLISGEKFPNEKMSFTELSANILEKKYKRHYRQVYQRGAVLAMLLDIEIIRLTNGEKTLFDVISELLTKYDAAHPFNEDTFFAEFVACVHPDLQVFFDKYVDGRDDIPYQKIFDAVGVEYQQSILEKRPRDPILENDIKYKRMGIGEKVIIKKVKKDNFSGFQKGDIIDHKILTDYFTDETGHYLPENTLIEIPVIRDNQEITIPFKISYVEKTTEHKMQIQKDMTPAQRRLYNIWLGIEN